MSTLTIPVHTNPSTDDPAPRTLDRWLVFTSYLAMVFVIPIPGWALAWRPLEPLFLLATAWLSVALFVTACEHMHNLHGGLRAVSYALLAWLTMTGVGSMVGWSHIVLSTASANPPSVAFGMILMAMASVLLFGILWNEHVPDDEHDHYVSGGSYCPERAPPSPSIWSLSPAARLA
ncbi:hypothetical protein FA95DRAFT_71970 [Auriscalpium vulgare]|uniref:Uncharacterized protein n=1 Tax=Auriscalpium vulgare TaxID=40419 RepID=A0ACB8RP76_9AGAM|nr:hypothetical protein FA95DRAFT_71970 [Auriscalpium vulgare]